MNRTAKKMLKLVKSKGVLVEIMEKGTPFIFTMHPEYKNDLGAVAIKNLFGVITDVYLAYEDFDGTIKYYDYPQITEKIAKKCATDNHDRKL
ncbi:hypothetical protein OBV_p-00060 (plasmid) [Oscillibacter valericigenes Sjm18-20]|nr:hypothetical protein OBV_p-00060 [Oscillibacter valericigenes Sjm18-20]